MLKISMIKAGNIFFNGSLTLICINTAPSIKKIMIRAVGKTKEGIQNPKISKKAELILMNPIT